MNPYSPLWDSLMTTAFVKHSHFTDGETEAQDGELAQGPQRITVGFQTAACPEFTHQLQKGLRGSARAARAASGPGEEGHLGLMG